MDGDAIPPRTLPGTDHPKAAYFTRGSGHNEKALYTERPDDYQNLMERLDAEIPYRAHHGTCTGNSPERANPKLA